MNSPSSSTKHLPAEIWNKILASLAHELPDYGDIEETSPKKIEPPASFIAGRSTLLHLCLMSRRLDDLARPFLYKTVVIWKAEFLLLLWRALNSRLELGHFIRELACWVALTRGTVIQKIISLTEEQLESSPSDRDLYQTIIKRHDVPQLLLFEILCRSQQLTMLSLLVPRSAEDMEYSTLMAMIAGSRRSYNSSIAMTTQDHDHQLEISHSLTSIELCRDWENSAAWGTEEYLEDVGFDHQDYWPLLKTSNLIRLHCYGDDASNGLAFLLEEDGSIGCGAPPEAYLGTVREVHLDSSSSGPNSLYYICRHAPQLQALRVSHRRHSQDSVMWVHAAANNLDSGLLMRAATLRHLHLDFYDSGEYRLTSLPHLLRLETLHIQLQTLFGKMSALNKYDIGDMFPSSLVELTLHDQWQQDVIETEERTKMYSGLMDPEEFQGGWIMSHGMTEAGFWYRYQNVVLRMLVRLCDVSADRLPQLRRVQYVSDFWSRRKWGQQNLFDEVQAGFSKRNIEFYAGEIRRQKDSIKS
ncbi:hypothetical protein GJ744_006219 [Endocarpon pusillum]|uniref:F-box domain-containing protein n=1 Tax=Endocarpon pusillum TaxID=364733 RepID=A0A8H7APF7_9EURO|nr:hypothetical protein GJ744_006219 [Endocarpon pusillum]